MATKWRDHSEILFCLDNDGAWTDEKCDLYDRAQLMGIPVKRIPLRLCDRKWGARFIVPRGMAAVVRGNRRAK